MPWSQVTAEARPFALGMGDAPEASSNAQGSRPSSYAVRKSRRAGQWRASRFSNRAWKACPTALFQYKVTNSASFRAALLFSALFSALLV